MNICHRDKQLADIKGMSAWPQKHIRKHTTFVCTCQADIYF